MTNWFLFSLQNVDANFGQDWRSYLEKRRAPTFVDVEAMNKPGFVSKFLCKASSLLILLIYFCQPNMVSGLVDYFKT